MTAQDVLELNNRELWRIVERANPVDPTTVAGFSYTGIDLSMPALFHAIAWKTFRKTFYRDPATEVVRGWNVMVEQTGWQSPPVPKRDRTGKPKTFGHYHLRDATGERFPRGWKGAHYLDYRVAGNTVFDFPARAGFCPLVAVNEGCSDLLLGWEVFRFGGLLLPISDYWLLIREGPLTEEDIVARPVPKWPHAKQNQTQVVSRSPS